MDQVLNLDAIFRFPEEVLVLPEAQGAGSRTIAG